MKILVLGAGFGGLELSSRLSEEFGTDLDIVLIDQNDGFVFGFSKLDVMFGKASPTSVVHPYSEINKPGVRFVQSTIQNIDPIAKRVETDDGTFEADIMVVALGADFDLAATPGLVESGDEFYSVAGAIEVRGKIENFKGGRIVIGVTSTPFKCPPAPSETALLMHDFLVKRGLRETSEISLVIPFGIPVPPSPEASQVLLDSFVERNIHWYPDQRVVALNPDSKVAILSDNTEIPFDLFLGIPVHKAPDVVLRSGMCVGGWIPVNSLTLETTFPAVYALGDVTSVGTAKAGVFSEGQAIVVADQIASKIRNTNSERVYDGRGVCYIEFGGEQVAKVDVTFLSGQKPKGLLEGPSHDFLDDKIEFGSSRIRRWFG